MGVRGSQRARGREGVGRGKSSKGPAFAAGKREKREREREKRNLPPLSLCRPTQPQPGHPRPRFVRYKLFARIPKLVLSPFRSPQRNSPAAGSFARQGSRPGSGPWPFLFVVGFLASTPRGTRSTPRHDTRFSTSFFPFAPTFLTRLIRQKKKGDLYKKIRRKKFRRFRGGGESKAAGNTHRKKAKMMRM